MCIKKTYKITNEVIEIPKTSVDKRTEFVESYLNLADQFLVQPEGVVANELNDRELFQTLSNLYLGNDNEESTNTLDFMMV